MKRFTSQVVLCCVLRKVLHDRYILFCCVVPSTSLFFLSLCAGFCRVHSSRCVLLWRARFVVLFCSLLSRVKRLLEYGELCVILLSKHSLYYFSASKF